MNSANKTATSPSPGVENSTAVGNNTTTSSYSTTLTTTTRIATSSTESSSVSTSTRQKTSPGGAKTNDVHTSTSPTPTKTWPTTRNKHYWEASSQRSIANLRMQRYTDKDERERDQYHKEYRHPGLLCTPQNFAQSSKFLGRNLFDTKVTSEAFLSITQNLKVTCLQGGTQTKL